MGKRERKTEWSETVLLPGNTVMNLDRMQMRQLDENMVDRGNPPPFHDGPPRLRNEGEQLVLASKGPGCKGPLGPEGTCTHAYINTRVLAGARGGSRNTRRRFGATA